MEYVRNRDFVSAVVYCHFLRGWMLSRDWPVSVVTSKTKLRHVSFPACFH